MSSAQSGDLCFPSQTTEKFSLKRTIKVGSNSGILDTYGRFSVGCPRLAFLEYQGIKIEALDLHRIYPFDMRVFNLRTWLGRVKPKEGVLELPFDLSLETESRSVTENGTEIVGEPDIVFIHRKQKKAFSGTSLKAINSLRELRSVLLKGEPELIDLIEAASYMMHLELSSFKLVYMLHRMILLPRIETTLSLYPKQGADQSSYFGYDRRGQVEAVLPFCLEYRLSLDENNTLSYQTLTDKPSSVKKSLVRQTDVTKFYEYVSKMGDEGSKLPPPPVNLGTDGKRKGWATCDYCPLRCLCKSPSSTDTEETCNEWFDRVLSELPTAANRLYLKGLFN
ncbi:hypothetical protein PN36_35035 [Candidatus Thiomargarita nelsonii]|uniref:Uncharacterized protein n=1 Tax=Candidatus Thiomargarita nelsonii TaxID=1003181 RepID=A0A4E0RAL4_9GAMM|nr:hypothetical protein PN36_35035 [Candidatus Thiomargarita nelsonii]